MPVEWETYYLMIGSSAAALIGLLFVVVTLAGESKQPAAEVGSRTFVTPTVFHFGTIVVICSATLMPGLPPHLMALTTGVVAFLGLIYAGIVISRMVRRRVQVPHWSDPVYYGALPGLAYLWLIASAAAFWSGSRLGPYGIAVGSLALLLIGIRDAWDLATWLAFHRQP
jgi:hypothetical protein